MLLKTAILPLLLCSNALGKTVISLPLDRKPREPVRKAGNDAIKAMFADLASTSGVIDLVNYEEYQFYGPMSFGTPAQELQVVYDTGSDVVWIPSTSCTSTSGLSCAGTNRFDSSASTTYSSDGSYFSESYGSGSISGVNAVDVVEAAGFSIESMSFGLVSDEDDSMSSFEADGITGMGYSSEWFDQVIAEYDDMEPVFSFYLTPAANMEGSQLMLGGYNESFLPENATWLYAPIKTDSFYGTYWTVDLRDVTVAGTSVSSGGVAIVDSGTSLIGVPDQDYYTLLDALTDGMDSCYYTWQGFMQCSDVSASDFPELTFVVEPGISLSLTGLSYCYCEDSTCMLQIDNIGSGFGDFYILGDVLMKTTYTLFDVGNAQLGFASLGEIDVNPSDDDNSPSVGEIVGYIAIFVVFGVAAWLTYRRCSLRRRQQRNYAPLSEPLAPPQPAYAAQVQQPYAQTGNSITYVAYVPPQQ